MKEKVEILDKIASGVDQVAIIAKEYGLTPAAVSITKKNEEAIRNLWESGQLKVKAARQRSTRRSMRHCVVRIRSNHA